MKEVTIVMDVVKAIEEEVVSIHQIMKEQPNLIFLKWAWKMTQLKAK